MRPWPVVLALLVPGPLAAQEGRLDVGLGVSSGTYLFEERTTTWSLATGAGVELGGVTLRGSLPIYLQNSTLIAGSGMGHIPTGGSSSGAVADSGDARRRGDRSGPSAGSAAPDFSHGAVEVPPSAVQGYQAALGDPTLTLAWRTRGRRATTLGLGITVKVPVADTATFGTGRWDAGASASVSHGLGRFLLGLDLAYWRLGDLDDLALRDPVCATGSLGYLGPGGWGGTVLLSGGTAVLEGYEAPISIGAGVHRLTGGQSWSLLSTLGLSETAPDLTLGVLWGARLTR